MRLLYRAFRWAGDRLGDQGVVAFVSNNGWLDSNSADGLRKSLTTEFSNIYVYDLRGNQRTAGDLSRKAGRFSGRDPAHRRCRSHSREAPRNYRVLRSTSAFLTTKVLRQSWMALPT